MSAGDLHPVGADLVLQVVLRLKVADEHRFVGVHHGGVNQRDVAQIVQVANPFETVVGRRVRLYRDDLAGVPDDPRERQHLGSDPGADVEHHVTGAERIPLQEHVLGFVGALLGAHTAAITEIGHQHGSAPRVRLSQSPVGAS